MNIENRCKHQRRPIDRSDKQSTLQNYVQYTVLNYYKLLKNFVIFFSLSLGFSKGIGTGDSSGVTSRFDWNGEIFFEEKEARKW